MDRFFVSPQSVIGSQVEIEGEDAHHICRVLRLKVGDHIEVIATSDVIMLTELVKVTGDLVQGSIIKEISTSQESPLNIHLYQGIAKGDKMDWIIQKAVELGAKSITPFLSRHSVVKLDHKQMSKKVKRWQKIATAAAQQSKRTYLPQVQPVLKFEQILAEFDRQELTNATTDKVIIMPYENEKQVKLADLAVANVTEVAVVIGPEGGFSLDEVREATKNGAQLISLGPRILRTETAGIVALSLVGYRWGDLN